MEKINSNYGLKIDTITVNAEYRVERSAPLLADAVSFLQRGAESSDMVARILTERYRCPEEFMPSSGSEKFQGSPGYFYFGEDTLCYGRLRNGKGQAKPAGVLYDAADDCVVEDGMLSLPFGPCEVIDNLRWERYPHCGFSSSEAFLKSVYYLLRPLTNAWMRKEIKKVRSRKWNDRTFPVWPVDTTVENIYESLLILALRTKGIDKIPFVWFWPQGAQSCAIMTHDVETSAGLEFCTRLLDLDETFGIKASFQFVPQGRYNVAPALRRTIQQRGFEVNVQDLNHDGRLFDSRQGFRQRAQAINRHGREYGAKGFRAAVLYRKPEWFEDLEFSFDMSIPNVAHLDPQRGGCCTVMPYFIGKILELPVTMVQDYTLFHVLNDYSIDLWKSQLDLIRGKHGLASFIVHPDYLLNPAAVRTYEHLLAHLYDLRETNAAWIGLPSEVDAWWRLRNRMSLVRHEDGWSIVGEGAEQASLAFALLQDGKLVYQMSGSTSPKC